MRKYLQVARLSAANFELVCQIAENASRYCASEKLTSYTFTFLKPGLTDYDIKTMLMDVIHGETTFADLNRKVQVGKHVNYGTLLLKCKCLLNLEIDMPCMGGVVLN